MADQDQRDDVARRAYERYEARGREDGHDQEDWFEAEREMRNRAPEAPMRSSGGGPGAGREQAGNATRGRE